MRAEQATTLFGIGITRDGMATQEEGPGKRSKVRQGAAHIGFGKHTARVEIPMEQAA